LWYSTDARTAEDHHQAEPHLHRVADVAQEEGRDQAGGVDAGREHDQPPVDERQRRAQQPHRREGKEGESPAPEQRQHNDRHRRRRELHRHSGRTRRIVPEDHLQHALDRSEHDQRIEAVPANQPVHGSKVLVDAPSRPPT
jgi:hypothetical protein